MAIISTCILSTSALMSIGGLSAANAASTPKTITTCTNIKTNVMRLIAKGACINGKMDIGKVIGTDGFPTKTNIFTKGVDLFCTMMSLKKTIPAGHVGNAIYDVVAKKDNQPKTVFPGEVAAGGSGGCSSLDQPVGKYEDKIYIDDALVAVLPFEVK